MSKKTIRNSSIVRFGSVAASVAALLAGCATKGDGDGSETHFLCSADSDCVSQGDGYRCVERKCAKAVGPEAGATGGNGNATNGGAGGDAFTPCTDPFYYPPDAGVSAGPPSVSPPGFVDGGIYGCYPPRNSAPPGWAPTAPLETCPGTSGRCVYEPTALPCGACDAPGYECSMGIAAVCDCGAGPIVDIYWDQWGCRCDNGQWNCGVVGPSGSSCQVCNSCINETRSTPYSPGMVVTGSAGVTMALTSTPAPPSLGDNTWTLSLTDEGGAPVSGATITAQQKMVDHGHAGVKNINVTDLGGGSYRAAPVNFNMVGYWETTFHVVRAPIDDRVVIKLCVQ